MIDYYTRRLLNLIPHGRDNAISTYELADAYGVSITGLMRVVNDLILNGALIVHCKDGYYIPTVEDYNETWQFWRSFCEINNDMHLAYKKSFFDYFMKNGKGGLSC